jgi:hypothetical protein
MREKVRNKYKRKKNISKYKLAPFFFIGGAKQKKSKPKGNSREFHQKERISKKRTDVGRKGGACF